MIDHPLGAAIVIIVGSIILTPFFVVAFSYIAGPVLWWFLFVFRLFGLAP